MIRLMVHERFLTSEYEFVPYDAAGSLDLVLLSVSVIVFTFFGKKTHFMRNSQIICELFAKSDKAEVKVLFQHEILIHEIATAASTALLRGLLHIASLTRL